MNERGRSQSAAPLFRLAINQLAAYDFLRLVSDGIHAPNPLQRILCFELFYLSFEFDVFCFRGQFLFMFECKCSAQLLLVMEHLLHLFLMSFYEIILLG